MAKTSRELLTEAAGIVQETRNWAAGAMLWGADVMREKCDQWLQEELSAEDGASSSPPSEEPPTDDRWMAVYLKAIEAWSRVQANRGEFGEQVPSAMCATFAKDVADAALDAAREQAKESIAKS